MTKYMLTIQNMIGGGVASFLYHMIWIMMTKNVTGKLGNCNDH